jgi:hypothetical protein
MYRICKGMLHNFWIKFNHADDRQARFFEASETEERRGILAATFQCHLKCLANILSSATLTLY